MAGKDGRFAAIPTTYAGVNFRSRLEARWAAMFDLLKLEWDYEPLDLRGWIPDFKISHGPLYAFAEVKPVSAALSDYPDEACFAKAVAMASEVPVMLIGAAPVGDLIGQPVGAPPQFTSDEWFFAQEDLSGLTNGEHGGRLDADCVANFWRQAGNKVQWRKPR